MMNKLYLQINDAGYITGWATVGGIKNGIEVDADLTETLDASIMGCQKYENGRIVTDEELLEVKMTSEENAREMEEIEAWFAWYDNQICQYQRCVRLGHQFDRSIDELDEEAVRRQERLRELKMRF